MSTTDKAVLIQITEGRAAAQKMYMNKGVGEHSFTYSKPVVPLKYSAPSDEFCDNTAAVRL